MTKEEINNIVCTKIIGHLTRTFRLTAYEWGVMVNIEDVIEGQPNHSFATRKFNFTSKSVSYDDLFKRICKFYSFGGKYYQPSLYYDDGTNIGWELPEELHSFCVFRTKTAASKFMENNGYDKGSFIIKEYNDDDIEDYTLLDEDGIALEIQSIEF